jgi:hypothetical protein
MWIVTTIYLPTGPNGTDEAYQVGADVEEGYRGHGCDVGEPSVAPAGVPLRDAELVDVGTLPDGWSDIAEAALVQAYDDHWDREINGKADHMYDLSKDDRDE